MNSLVKIYEYLTLTNSEEDYFLYIVTKKNFSQIENVSKNFISKNLLCLDVRTSIFPLFEKIEQNSLLKAKVIFSWNEKNEIDENSIQEYLMERSMKKFSFPILFVCTIHFPAIFPSCVYRNLIVKKKNSKFEFRKNSIVTLKFSESQKIIFSSLWKRDDFRFEYSKIDENMYELLRNRKNFDNSSSSNFFRIRKMKFSNFLDENFHFTTILHSSCLFHDIPTLYYKICQYENLFSYVTNVKNYEISLFPKKNFFEMLKNNLLAIF